MAKKTDGTPQAWKVLESIQTFTDPWIRLRTDRVQLQNGKVLEAYHTLEYPDWVHTIAVTPALDVVLIEQYRHGIRKVLTELPAGAVEGAEEPLAAMKRELLEETGYISDDWHLIGRSPANAARQTNRVHSFLALNARKVAEQSLDEGEIIAMREMPFHEFVARIGSRDIELPGLQLTALFWLSQYLDRSSDPEVRRLRT